MQMLLPACLAAAPAPPPWQSALLGTWAPNLLLAIVIPVVALALILRRIPAPAEDAAILDGCGFWRTAWHLVLPRLGPVWLAAGLMLLFTGWEDCMTWTAGFSSPSPDTLYSYKWGIVVGGHFIDGGCVAVAGTLLLIPAASFLYLLLRYATRGRFTVSGS
jgi:ABC-type glycerol-3-phosphate transport system permease component